MSLTHPPRPRHAARGRARQLVLARHVIKFLEAFAEAAFFPFSPFMELHFPAVTIGGDGDDAGDAAAPGMQAASASAALPQQVSTSSAAAAVMRTNSPGGGHGDDLGTEAAGRAARQPKGAARRRASAASDNDGYDSGGDSSHHTLRPLAQARPRAHTFDDDDLDDDEESGLHGNAGAGAVANLADMVTHHLHVFAGARPYQR